MSLSLLDNGYGIYSFNELLEMIKNRYFDGYDETLNYKDKAVCEAERQRERDFYATYPKFVIFANLYVPLFRICEYGRAAPISRGVEPSFIYQQEEHRRWLAQQQEILEVVDIVDHSITGIEITKVPSVLRHNQYVRSPLRVFSVAWSRCGQFLATGDDKNLILRRSDGTEVFTKLHPDSVFGVCFSADSQRVLSVCFDNAVRIFDVDGGKKLMELRGHTQRVLSVSCSNDGALIATGSCDSSLRLWDSTTGAEIWKFDGHGGWVLCAAFNRDGTRVATSSGADGFLRVFSVQERRLLHEVKAHDQALCCAFSGDSRLIASGGDSGILILFDAETFAEVGRITHPPALYILSVTFDTSSRFIASATGGALQLPTLVHVYEVATGEEVFRFEHRNDTYSVSWSPCGNLLASASSDKTVRIHDVSHLKCRRRRAAQAVVVEVADDEVVMT